MFVRQRKIYHSDAQHFCERFFYLSSASPIEHIVAPVSSLRFICSQLRLLSAICWPITHFTWIMLNDWPTHTHNWPESNSIQKRIKYASKGYWYHLWWSNATGQRNILFQQRAMEIINNSNGEYVLCIIVVLRSDVRKQTTKNRIRSRRAKTTRKTERKKNEINQTQQLNADGIIEKMRAIRIHCVRSGIDDAHQHQCSAPPISLVGSTPFSNRIPNPSGWHFVDDAIGSIVVVRVFVCLCMGTRLGHSMVGCGMDGRKAERTKHYLWRKLINNRSQFSL